MGEEDTGVQKAADALTDGTGVSKLTAKKLIKDFITDALLSIPASLLMAGISGVPQDQAQLIIAVNAVALPVIGALYRAVLRWAQSEE